MDYILSQHRRMYDFAFILLMEGICTSKQSSFDDSFLVYNTILS